MHLFITGSNSFIGQELIRQCDEKGITITGIDVAPGTRSDCTVADICDADIGKHIPENVDAIIHLAGLTRDPDCKNQAKKCFQANVMGTLNLIDAAQEREASQFIFASSEWVYDSFEPNVAKTERSAVDASKLTSEYAFSKYVSEVNLRQKFQHGFMPVAILRFGIVYGPRKSNWSAVEALFNTVATSESVSVGALATSRRFIHVSDIAAGILAAVGLPGFEVINLQGANQVSLGDVIAESQSVLGRNIPVSESNPAAPSIRLIDNSKAASVLSWSPQIPLAEGLRSVGTVLGHLKA